MSKYTTRIEADTAYPVLLSNGNLVSSGKLGGGRWGPGIQLIPMLTLAASQRPYILNFVHVQAIYRVGGPLSQALVGLLSAPALNSFDTSCRSGNVEGLS